jgi:hypothetical protein
VEMCRKALRQLSWKGIGWCWGVLLGSVPGVSHGTKEKGLTLMQALDFSSGAAGDRTPDLMTASHALSHLSYSPSLLLESTKSTGAIASCQEPGSCSV